MAVGLALAANTQVSALTSLFVCSLLLHHSLPDLIEINRRRLRENYDMLTEFFISCYIPYVPCNAGLYVFAQMAIDAQTWDDEADMVQKLKESGVLVSAGRAYHIPEADKGWMRIGFAVDKEILREAIARMGAVFEIAGPKLNGAEEQPTKRANYE